MQIAINPSKVTLGRAFMEEGAFMYSRNNNQQNGKIFTIKQVARKLQISTHTLRMWAKQEPDPQRSTPRVLRPIKLVGIHHLRYSNEAIEAFLDANTVNSSGEKHEPF